MIINATQLKFDRSNEVSISKVMFNFFLETYKETIRMNTYAIADLSVCRAANAEYLSKAFGIDDRLPYNSAQIEYKKQQVITMEEEMKDAEAIVKFLRDKFLKGLT